MNDELLALKRRHFLACLSAMGLGSTLMPEALTIAAQGRDIVTIDVLEAAQKIAGVSFAPCRAASDLVAHQRDEWPSGRLCRVARRQPARR